MVSIQKQMNVWLSKKTDTCLWDTFKMIFYTCRVKITGKHFFFFFLYPRCLHLTYTVSDSMTPLPWLNASV